ncbi:MAG: DUF359 domain-containing protein [Candidatus Aenigmarchaeota archaeon]|nr:DUF359 domain-containing protein [Candidatus Aenigmarchaeota archaeon]
MIGAGFEPDIIVYDLRRYRKEVEKKTRKILESFRGEIFKVRNPPSTITKEFWNAIKESLELGKPAKIIVEGEEDLAVTPFIMEGDYDTVVLYGLLDKGFVFTEIDKDLKDKVGKLLERMK